MFQVHKLGPIGTNCDRVVMALRCFQWAEQENVSSFKGKRNMTYVLIVITYRFKITEFLLSWVFIYISKVKLQDHRWTLL